MINTIAKYLGKALGYIAYLFFAPVIWTYAFIAARKSRGQLRNMNSQQIDQWSKDFLRANIKRVFIVSVILWVFIIVVIFGIWITL